MDLETPETTGPERGSLVVAGGKIKDLGIYQRFLDLAGGPDALIVIVPTAAPDEELEKEDFAPNLIQAHRQYGFHRIAVLHTLDREEADSEAFIQPIREAGGVWMTGGRQWRLADSYLHTRTHRELDRLLARGGVIGGTSAGASIQGDYLARGDTESNLKIVGDHTEGFGFIRNVAIDQHVLARNRQFDLKEIIDRHPHLLGLGIDEDTAIVVTGDEFEVIGSSYVVIYDGASFYADYNGPIPKHVITRLPNQSHHFYQLKAGYRYNLRKRKVVHWDDGEIVDRSD